MRGTKTPEDTQKELERVSKQNLVLTQCLVEKEGEINRLKTMIGIDSTCGAQIDATQIDWTRMS